MKADLESSLEGVNRYNPQNLVALEEYVKVMIDENQYDQEAVLTALKLYQLNPDKYNEQTVRRILLKTLMALPRSDFMLAKCLLDSNRVDPQKAASTCTPEMTQVLYIGAVLEACDFASFWKIMRGQWTPPEDDDGKFKPAEAVAQIREPAEAVAQIREVKGFEDAVRSFACQVIHVTFQRIDKDQLSRLLGGVTDAQIAEYTSRHGWTTQSDGTIFIQNHEATIKSRNIEEKLEFGAIKDILRSIG
uniref:Eukaryotic translation initiation factor 3 subunit K n=1 Tax=Plectus sambesii TaxID=2011161 RepID=A0A914XMZ4_9BILA